MTLLFLSGSNKYSPYISVAFYCGKNYAPVAALEKAIGTHRAYYHIQQYSTNRRAMKGLEYDGPFTWDVDTNSPPSTLVNEMHRAIKGVAYPFYDRFADIVVARDAIANDDPWCFGGKAFWHHLIKLDAVLGDLDHFKHWARDLDSLRLNRANEMLAQIESVQARPNNSFKPKPLRGSA